MAELPKPPKAYEDFEQRFPKLAEAWGLMAEAGADGPLDPRTQRLLKLAIAIGAVRQGAVRASTRKALSQGIAMEELQQVVALAAATTGLPSAVAAFCWIEEAAKNMES